MLIIKITVIMYYLNIEINITNILKIKRILNIVLLKEINIMIL